MFRQNEFDPASEMDFANALEEEAKILEQFLDNDLIGMRPGFYPSKIQQVLSSLPKKIAPLEAILDRNLAILEGQGMRSNPETKKIENTFAGRSTSKVQTVQLDDGRTVQRSPKDQSIFDPEENFGKVIKQAYGLTWQKDSDGKMGMLRGQASLEMVDAYEKEVKGSPRNESRYLRDIIGLRVMHNGILGPANDVLDRLKSDMTDERNQMLVAGQLNSAITMLRQAAASIRTIHSYAHLMTAKEFQLATGVTHSKQPRPGAIKKIDSYLKMLEEPTTFQKTFWRQRSLSLDSRLSKLLLLKMEVNALLLKMKVDNALKSSGVDVKYKKSLENLLPQIQYGIETTGSLIRLNQAKLEAKKGKVDEKKLDVSIPQPPHLHP